MNTQKLKDLVETSDMVQFQKNMTIGLLSRIEEQETKKIEDRLLIEKVANEKKTFKILYSSDEVKIYSILHGKDDWDVKYPVRSIFLNSKKGIWERVCTVSPSFDTAFLNYLENKYLGSNSRFTDFALKMLEIKIEE